ncbi:MAG: histidine kinase [Candidatus Promineifilaceae bacterium]|nr:histidine kinase [Candidatus Promineifilaceae bacterium]
MSPTADQSKQQIYNLLLLFRWLTLIPPLLLLVVGRDQAVLPLRYLVAFVTAFLICLAVSLGALHLNRSLIKHPWLLALDLLLVTGLIAITGGWRSPYFLFALTPMLAAAFFFQLRGALLAATFFLPLYLIAIIIDSLFVSNIAPDWLLVISTIIGAFLISSIFGYASLLLNQLQKSQIHLERTNQDLVVLHELSTSLQRSANLLEVQDQVLAALTQNLNFRRVAIGLIERNQESINSWRIQGIGESTAEWIEPVEPMPLNDKDEPIVEALLSKQMRRLPRFARQGKGSNLSRFGIGDGLVCPLTWGAQPIGVILADLGGKEEDASQLNALGAIARQTAVTLGMMITRRRRARESAIQEERTRIALDLHDSISQTLFGLVYTLQGCLRLLPEQPQEVIPELESALAAAESVRLKIRETINDIWPSELTAQQFEADLRAYAEDVLQASGLAIDFEIRGDFSTLSPPARRGIYRICQEGLSNIVQHAGAANSRVCVDVADGRARFILRDDGRGFDLDDILEQKPAEYHFGLTGMRERAAALGGSCDIYSQPDEGTSIIIDIPANAQTHHELPAGAQSQEAGSIEPESDDQ